MRTLLNQLTRYDLDADAHDAQIGIVALALFSTVRDARTPAGERRVADALVMLSENAVGPGMRDILREVSIAIVSGETGLWALDDPFAASPS